MNPTHRHPSLPARREVSSHTLSESRRRLLQVMSHVRFGRIPRLVVRDGEPVLDDSLELIRKLKFPGANDPHPATRRHDYILCKEALDFLAELTRLGDGVLLDLQFRDGLPRECEVVESLAL